MGDREFAEKLLMAIQVEIRPKLDQETEWEDDGGNIGGYDCCGCSTYDQIVEDIEALIRREGGLPLPAPSTGEGDGT